MDSEYCKQQTVYRVTADWVMELKGSMEYTDELHDLQGSGPVVVTLVVV